jgi:hypothetical protein
MLIRHQELRMKTRSMFRSHSMHWLSRSAMAWACAPTLAQGKTAFERKACVAGMPGPGSTIGSVPGGRILRETVTVVPVPM